MSFVSKEGGTKVLWFSKKMRGRPVRTVPRFFVILWREKGRNHIRYSLYFP